MIVAIVLAFGVWAWMYKIHPQLAQTPTPTPEISQLYSQSGRITEIQPYQIKVAYASTIQVNGVPSSLTRVVAVEVGASTPIFKLVRSGEGYTEAAAAFKDLKVGGDVVLYAHALIGNDILVPLKIDIAPR